MSIQVNLCIIFHIALRIADYAQLCNECLDQRMTTRIMSATRNSDVRKKLMSFTPFPITLFKLWICAEATYLKWIVRTRLPIDKWPKWRLLNRKSPKTESKIYRAHARRVETLHMAQAGNVLRLGTHVQKVKVKIISLKCALNTRIIPKRTLVRILRSLLHQNS